jgi:hypothetical protein
MDSHLEALTATQQRIANSLLILAAEETATSSGLLEAARRRHTQTMRLADQLGIEWKPEARPTLKSLVEGWWREEQPRLVEPDTRPGATVEEDVAYRLLVLFGRNLIMCPFTQDRKRRFQGARTVADTGDFEEMVVRHFERFCLESGKVLAASPRVVAVVTALSNADLARTIRSARHKLTAKDWAIAKGALVGLTAGVGTSLVLGPVIGTYIGELAGLSGAAATSYGLALLGGGSVASGGFGMVGGTAVLGFLFGSAKGAHEVSKQVGTDLLGLAEALQKLPVMLAVGAILRGSVPGTIPLEIFNTIADRGRQLEGREAEIAQSAAPDSQRLKEIRATRRLYEGAREMAVTYRWFSGYDAAAMGQETYSRVSKWVLSRVAERLLP